MNTMKTPEEPKAPLSAKIIAPKGWCCLKITNTDAGTGLSVSMEFNCIAIAAGILLEDNK